MGFKHWIKTSRTCEVTIFLKGTINGQFSFRNFPRDFRDFESSYLLNGNRH